MRKIIIKLRVLFFVAMFFILNFGVCYAQISPPNITMGFPTAEAFAMTSYPLDTTANAVYLSKRGDVNIDIR